MSEQELIRRLDKIEKAVERIERKLSMLMQEKKKGTWVKAGVVTKATGWNGNRMRIARENGYVEYKKGDKGSYFYNIESIHPIHLKKPE